MSSDRLSNWHGVPIHPNSHLPPGTIYYTQQGWVIHEWAPQRWHQRLWRKITRRPLPPSGMDILRRAIADRATDEQ